MHKGTKAVMAGLMTAALMTSVAPFAAANDADKINEGNCSGRSDWKYKASPENGKIEVEYEVDQNRNGDTWKVRLRHEGDLFFSGSRVTRAPSGSFEVRRVVGNRAGTDNFTARAVNQRTGEVCRGAVAF
ncbi:MAG: hypothetical protein H0U16_09685 [Actinobacteria bacterium]|nr:hypothetical protein [Actinomycetota bacterium]